MKASESCRPSPDETNSITGGAASGAFSAGRADTIIEEIDRYAEDARYFEQPSRADAIDAFFVFLDLLEREAEQIAQTFLTHADQHAPYAHAISNLSIDGIGFFRHSFIGGVDLPRT